MPNRKSRFWTFVFSFIPGAGHMYLGLQKQGVQLMLLFTSYIFIMATLNLGILGVFLPVIWFYSMFDAMGKSASEEMLKDDDIGIVKWFRKDGLYIRNRAKIMGFGLIGLGGYMTIERVVFPMFNTIFNSRVRGVLQTGIIAILLIAIGVKLLIGNKNNRIE